MTPLELARHEAEEAASWCRECLEEILEHPDGGERRPSPEDAGADLLLAIEAHRERYRQQREAEELAYLENVQP